jgi:hypothetical protein
MTGKNLNVTKLEIHARIHDFLARAFENFYIDIWSCMLLEDVLQILPLLMPKTFVIQFVFVWGHEVCLMGITIKNYSLMMSLARPFEIQNEVDFSLNYLEDMSYPKTRCNG